LAGTPLGVRMMTVTFPVAAAVATPVVRASATDEAAMTSNSTATSSIFQAVKTPTGTARITEPGCPVRSAWCVLMADVV
jgi:hypothetical protein